MKSPLLQLAFAVLASADNESNGHTLNRLVQRPRKWANGPCAICSKPNVKRGRDFGTYLCNDHYKESQP